MAWVQRSFQNESDKYRMAALAAQFPAQHLRIVDLPYRLSAWALDDPDNARLWFDVNQQLLAWAVLQTPFWTIDITCHPGAETGLYAQVLAWADQRASALVNSRYGHECWFVTVFAEQTDHIRDLEAAGFKCQADVGEDSWSKVLLRRSGQLPVKEYKLPIGFTMRPLAGESEVQAYVDLHQSVFESKNMTLEWRRRTLKHPAYTPDLDMVIEAPDRRLAAFCIGWLNQNPELGLIGQVEPLGCHKDFRRYALGRVALAEILRRLREAGAEQIFVETDNYRDTAFRLYQSLDFEVFQDVLVFRKDTV